MKTQKPKTAVVNDPYRYRGNVDRSEDVAMRHMANDYGKSPQVDQRKEGGTMVSPRRTIIHGR
jgi:hypothetical protein